MPEAARTLVKSPPELWAEVSDPESLARHLGDVGEITITRLEPESTVAWEGDRIRGTVDLAPAGWGTKVTVTAEEVEEVTGASVAPPAEPEVQPEPEGPAEEPEPQAAAEPRKLGFFARLFGRREEPAAAPEPEPESEPEPEPVAIVEPEAPTVEVDALPDTEAVLDGMLGSLGSAHHRPFSR